MAGARRRGQRRRPARPRRGRLDPAAEPGRRPARRRRRRSSGRRRAAKHVSSRGIVTTRFWDPLDTAPAGLPFPAGLRAGRPRPRPPRAPLARGGPRTSEAFLAVPGFWSAARPSPASVAQARGLPVVGLVDAAVAAASLGQRRAAPPPRPHAPPRGRHRDDARAKRPCASASLPWRAGDGRRSTRSARRGAGLRARDALRSPARRRQGAGPPRRAPGLAGGAEPATAFRPRSGRGPRGHTIS